MIEPLIVKRVVAGHYVAVQGTTEVGEIILDGRPGVDDYPWTWSLIEPPFGSGAAATKRSALDSLREKLRRRR